MPICRATTTRQKPESTERSAVRLACSDRPTFWASLRTGSRSQLLHYVSPAHPHWQCRQCLPPSSGFAAEYWCSYIRWHNPRLGQRIPRLHRGNTCREVFGRCYDWIVFVSRLPPSRFTALKREIVLQPLYGIPLCLSTNCLSSCCRPSKVYEWPGRFPSYPSYPYLGYFPVTVTSMHP